MCVCVCVYARRPSTHTRACVCARTPTSGIPPLGRPPQISVVSSPTFGGNVENSLYRVGGTLVAAVWAVVIESAFPLSIAAELVGTLMFVLPLMYLKLGDRYRRLGGQALAAFVSIELAYIATPVNPGVWEGIVELAYKRALAIVVGVLVVLITGRLVWPTLSRVELRLTLARALHELGNLYCVLQASVEGGGHAQRWRDDLPKIKRLEAAAQDLVLHAEDQLVLAAAEPRLKGPFPAAPYDRLLMHAQRGLDQLTLMRTLLLRGAGAELYEDLRDRSSPLAVAALQERREQAVSMQLYLYMLEAAVAAKRPLLFHMPDISRNVRRAFRKWRKLMVSLAPGAGGDVSALDPNVAAASMQPSPPVADAGSVLVTAYAVALLDIARTLESMSVDVKTLFGVNDHLSYGRSLRRASTVG